MARMMPAFDGSTRTLRAARRGDPAALERLYRRFAPPILGYLRGAGAAEPEDLTSEVFTGMIRGLHRFEGDEDAFRGWLFTIARRRLQDERRRAGARHVPVEPDTLLDLTEPADDDPEESALLRMQLQETLEALDGLTPDQREVLLLRFVADLPVEETARLLGKRPGAVKMLQRRGLARLSSLAARAAKQPVTRASSPAMYRVR